VSNGANIESKDKYGQTPLFHAAGNTDGAVVQLLLENGAQIDARDNYGRTPLSRAEAHGRKEVVKLILEAKVRHVGEEVHRKKQRRK
jgi:ankyrin repeat protein